MVVAAVRGTRVWLVSDNGDGVVEICSTGCGIEENAGLVALEVDCVGFDSDSLRSVSNGSCDSDSCCASLAMRRYLTNASSSIIEANTSLHGRS